MTPIVARKSFNGRIQPALFASLTRGIMGNFVHLSITWQLGQSPRSGSGGRSIKGHNTLACDMSSEIPSLCPKIDKIAAPADNNGYKVSAGSWPLTNESVPRVLAAKFNFVWRNMRLGFGLPLRSSLAAWLLQTLSSNAGVPAKISPGSPLDCSRT